MDINLSVASLGGNPMGRPLSTNVSSKNGTPGDKVLSWVLLMTTLEPSETVVAQASPNPGAVIERRTLTRGSVNIGNTIYASCRARGRHDDVWALGSRFDKVSPSSALLPC